ncbi:MAG TPA: outer membrane lipid asymmetry maintenance protein MlaD, partial [Pedomonas sp.]|nr:outer membrane lipid asymmetry maintenance protein MlaD [Pedomonas sp.]
MQLKESLVEALIGAVVLLVAGLFLFYAYSNTAVGRAGSGYSLIARFPSAVGVNVGTDVRISG